MKKIYAIMTLAIITIILPLSSISATESLASKLKGRILLQTEGVGQAWYVNPQTGTRAFLGRPADALKIMQGLSIGMSNANLARISSIGTLDVDKVFAQKYSGRILLQVENYGQAWYVNPVNLKKYYLGSPADAFTVMSNLSLGITNGNLSEIPIDSRFGDSN